jgi:hypothetical protein
MGAKYVVYSVVYRLKALIELFLMVSLTFKLIGPFRRFRARKLLDVSGWHSPNQYDSTQDTFIFISIENLSLDASRHCE